MSERRVFNKCFLKHWLPVFAWMALIFIGSTNLLSSQNTSRFIGPFLRWLKPDLSPDTVKLVQTVVRKGGHVTEYAILAILVWHAARTSRDAGWSPRAAWLALVIVAMYAVTDEVHQSFVPTRQGSAIDVIIDVCGGGTGLALLWGWGRHRRTW